MIEDSGYQLRPHENQTSPRDSKRSRESEKPEIHYSLGAYRTLNDSNPPKFGESKEASQLPQKGGNPSPSPVRGQDSSRTTESQSSQILGG